MGGRREGGFLGAEGSLNNYASPFRLVSTRAMAAISYCFKTAAQLPTELLSQHSALHWMQVAGVGRTQMAVSVWTSSRVKEGLGGQWRQGDRTGDKVDTA